MFKSFYRLSDAVGLSITSPQSSVFSWEIALKGKRKFLLAPVEEFWTKYETWPDKKYYEVINSDHMSKLYFDVEFPVKENLQKDGLQMAKKLLEVTSELLKEKFNHDANDKDILVLEASTSLKFSLHIIFTKTVFRNNQIVGKFVKNFVKKRLHEQFPGQFEVMKRGRIIDFVDSSVYGKSQNFRLFLSRKLGKMNPLLLCSSLNSPDWKCDSSENRRNVFMMSLISNIDASISPLSIEETSQELRQPTSAYLNVHGGTKGTIYTEIEEMVNQIVKPGFIRDSIIYPGYNSIIVFSITGTRYCANVRREHTSNNVYYICNLNELTLVQACHSCKDFRSFPIPIPAEKVSWLDFSNEDEDKDLHNWN